MVGSSGWRYMVHVLSVLPFSVYCFIWCAFISHTSYSSIVTESSIQILHTSYSTVTVAVTVTVTATVTATVTVEN